jgi:FAD binding domain/Berberine and berberine like
MSHRYTPLQLDKKRSMQWLQSTDSNSSIPTEFPLSKQMMASMESVITGKIVFPWSPGYEQDRQEFDDLYPTYPVVIVYAVSFADVRECLKLAHDAGMEVAIRSSGHSLACFSVCSGMVIDLSEMNNVTVDHVARTIEIEPGANFSKIYPAVEPYGLHMPTGDCPTVCPAGFIMGGGYGMTTRMFGMGCDNAIELTVMLADGRIAVANKDQNPDLFWAIRGGTGGNFGVLLKTKFILHTLGDIMGVQIRWPIEANPARSANILYAIQENYLSPGVLPQMGIQTILSSDDNAVKTLFFCATWIGDEPSFTKALEPLLSISGFTIKKFQGKYSDVNNQVLDGTPDIPDDIMGFARSRYIDRSLAESEWLNIVQYFIKNAPNQYTMIDMEAYGGNVSNIPENSCAFIHRNVKVDFFTEAFFDQKTNDRAKNEAWTNGLFEFMKPYASNRSYQNYPYRGQEDYRNAYWGNYYNQLVLIKKKYDPENFFKYQQSIGPDLIDNTAQIHLFKPSPITYEPF